jgi:hypothetical protein
MRSRTPTTDGVRRHPRQAGTAERRQGYQAFVVERFTGGLPIVNILIVLKTRFEDKVKQLMTARNTSLQDVVNEQWEAYPEVLECERESFAFGEERRLLYLVLAADVADLFAVYGEEDVTRIGPRPYAARRAVARCR